MAFALFALLGGCAAVPPAGSGARVGMAKANVVALAGEPLIRQTNGRSGTIIHKCRIDEIWTYQTVNSPFVAMRTGILQTEKILYLTQNKVKGIDESTVRVSSKFSKK